MHCRFLSKNCCPLCFYIRDTKYPKKETHLLKYLVSFLFLKINLIINIPKQNDMNSNSLASKDKDNRYFKGNGHSSFTPYELTFREDASNSNKDKSSPRSKFPMLHDQILYEQKVQSTNKYIQYFYNSHTNNNYQPYVYYHHTRDRKYYGGLPNLGNTCYM